MNSVASFQQRLEIIKQKLNYQQLLAQLQSLTTLSQQTGFWNQPDSGQIMKQISDIQLTVDQIKSIQADIDVLAETDQYITDSGDSSLQSDYQHSLQLLEQKLAQIDKTTYLCQKYDSKNIIFSIHAGQGGVDAMDWASMLYRMYTRYFQIKSFRFQVLNITHGDEAGIKSVSLKVTGDKPYGYLRGEAGVHRLVRLSPFNADNLRQTSFAKVEVSPIFDSADQFSLKPEEVDFSAYRSGGSGGQNVNKVSTAVRLTHKPSGLSVSCQSERSQDQNRQLALEMLTSQVWQIYQKEQDKEKNNASLGKDVQAGWGNQIRSYVLHPYKMVKDNRTKVETSQVNQVLDGDLDQFIEAEIKLL